MLNILIDVAVVLKNRAPFWMFPNNYIYNIHSIFRFICFSSFFIYLKQPFLVNLKKWIPVFSILFVVINFLFFENFFRPNSFSSRLFAVEAGLLLFYCLQYYLYHLSEDKVFKRGGDFWIVTGLSIYVIFNFPYFLLYTTLVEHHLFIAMNFWNFHNITYIILCIFIAKAFYAERNN